MIRTIASIVFLAVVAIGGIRALREANREAEARRAGRSEDQDQRIRR